MKWKQWLVVCIVCQSFIVYCSYELFFFVFAMHVQVGAVVTKLLYLALPKSYIFAIPNFIATTIILLLIIELFCVALKKLCTRVFEFLWGEGIEVKIRNFK